MEIPGNQWDFLVSMKFFFILFFWDPVPTKLSWGGSRKIFLGFLA